MDEWFLYVIQTKHGEWYTGISIDPDKRLKAHQEGRGAKYLRGRGPLEIVWRQKVGDKKLALKYERSLKKLTKAKKELLITNQLAFGDD